MNENKRIRRTPEQLAADLDFQISKLEDSLLEWENRKTASAAEFNSKLNAIKEKIAKCKDKKKALLAPPKPKARKSKAEQIRRLVKQAQKTGMDLNEIADKLGIERGEQNASASVQA